MKMRVFKEYSGVERKTYKKKINDRLIIKTKKKWPE